MDYYKYVGIYVDDLEIDMKDPQSLIDTLKTKFGFKIKGTGDLNYHLGAKFCRDPDGTLTMSAQKYTDRMLDAYQRTFGCNPKPYTSPMSPGDHPELDNSALLNSGGIVTYQSLIGQIQWAVTIGRMDVHHAVMTMSTFWSNPRIGHLSRLQHIIGYLVEFTHACIRFRTKRPDLSMYPDTYYNWEHTVYGSTRKETPKDCPIPLGKTVDTINLC